MALLFCSDGFAPERAQSDLPGERPGSVLGPSFFEDELLMIVIAFALAYRGGRFRAEIGLWPSPVGRPSVPPSYRGLNKLCSL